MFTAEELMDLYNRLKVMSLNGRIDLGAVQSVFETAIEEKSGEYQECGLCTDTHHKDDLTEEGLCNGCHFEMSEAVDRLEQYGTD